MVTVIVTMKIPALPVLLVIRVNLAWTVTNLNRTVKKVNKVQLEKLSTSAHTRVTVAAVVNVHRDKKANRLKMDHPDPPVDSVIRARLDELVSTDKRDKLVLRDQPVKLAKMANPATKVHPVTMPTVTGPDQRDRLEILAMLALLVRMANQAKMVNRVKMAKVARKARPVFPVKMQRKVRSVPKATRVVRARMHNIARAQRNLDTIKRHW